MARIGPPLVLACTATSVRRIRGALVVRYAFEFTQDGDAVYEGDQTALFHRITDATAAAAG